MKRLLATAALVLLICVSSARPCAPAYARGMRVGITAESALIVFDEKTKTEHFIRRANFDTTAPYFGFLVPTPSQPHLAEMADSTFNILEEWTAPEIKYEQKVRYVSLFDTIKTTTHAGRAAPNEAAPKSAPVQVLDRQHVGGMDAVVLKATDAEALRKWLNEHGYEAREALTAWLEWYVKNGWYLTAFQYKKENASSHELRTKAVRMTFQTDRPFYPYREPADQRAGTEFKARSLRVFYVGTGRVTGKLGDGEWHPGRGEWSNPLTEFQAKHLQTNAQDSRPDAKLSAPALELPEGAWLTVFDDRSTPRPGTDEVYFERSESQEKMKRPPIIRYTYVERVHPGEMIVASVLCGLLVIGGGLLAWRFGRR
jgi:hypothetical protein